MQWAGVKEEMTAVWTVWPTAGQLDDQTAGRSVSLTVEWLACRWVVLRVHSRGVTRAESSAARSVWPMGEMSAAWSVVLRAGQWVSRRVVQMDQSTVQLSAEQRVWLRAGLWASLWAAKSGAPKTEQRDAKSAEHWVCHSAPLSALPKAVLRVESSVDRWAAT